MERNEMYTGLKEAMGLVLPYAPAIDCGCGTGTRACIIKKFGRNSIVRVTAYDIDPGVEEAVQKNMQEQGVEFSFKVRDVLDLEFKPSSITVISVGIVIYNPKPTVREFLKKAFKWLMPGGILDVEFPTYEDGAHQSGFVEYACIPFEEEGSYIYCGSDPEPVSLGQNGGSFWNTEEVDNLVKNLGAVKIIHNALCDFCQVVSSKERMYRSFYIVTAKKT